MICLYDNIGWPVGDRIYKSLFHLCISAGEPGHEGCGVADMVLPLYTQVKTNIGSGVMWALYEEAD